jgi:hypothetical protein
MGATVWQGSGVAIPPNLYIVEYTALATAAQTVVNINTFSYAPEGNNIQVFVNGLIKRRDIDYEETSSTSITFTSPLSLNDKILIIGSNLVPTSGDAGLRSDLAASDGSLLVTNTQPGTGSASRTLHNKLTEIISVTDKTAVVADKTTDNTAAILAAAIAASADDIELLRIPYGVKYNRYSLLNDPTFPTNIRFWDESGINTYNGAGESNFSIGIVSGDRAEDDTHLLVESGHHPTLQTNNPGTAGTTSGDGRLASWLWSVGHHLLNVAADKVGGYRTAGLMQWRLTPGGAWDLNIRSLAPGPAIENNYEFWSDTEAIGGPGVYRATANYHYKSTAAIAAGSGEPTHTSGTIGNWQFIDYTDRGVFALDEYGRLLIGSGGFNEGTFTIRASYTDPSGAVIANFIPRGLSKSSNIKTYATDNAGAEKVGPHIRTETVGVSPTAVAQTYVLKSDASSAILTFTDIHGMVVGYQAGSFYQHNSGSTTPDFSGKYIVLFENASPVSITAITIPDGAELECHFINSNVTFVHSSTLMLTGAVNANPNNGSVITFRKYPNSISTRVVETCRSFK